MNYTKIALSGIAALVLFGGCSTRELNNDFNVYSAKAYKDYKIGNKKKIDKVMKKDEIRIKKDYIDLSVSKSLSSVLKELGSLNNRIYMLDGKDIRLKSTEMSKILKIKDFFGLKRYIEDTTNYTLDIINNKYVKDRVKKVVLVDKESKRVGFDNIDFHVYGKQTVSSALSTLAKKIGYSIVYDKDLSNDMDSYNRGGTLKDFRDMDVAFNGNNISDFLNYIEKNFNVYADIDYNNKMIIIKKYKTQVFTIYPLNYRVSKNITVNSIEATSESGGNSGTQSTTQSYTSNVVEDIKRNLTNLLDRGPNAKIIFNEDSGKVVVKTTRNNMEEIKKYIEKINDVYNKQVEVTVSIYEFVLNKNFDFGTDILTDYSNGKSKYHLSTSNLLKSILTGTFLNSKGKVNVNVGIDNDFIRYAKSYSYDLTMVNNIPKTITIQNSQDYVKSITSTTTSNTATTVSSNIEVSTVNQGISIDVLPRIIGDKISIKTDVKINNLNDFKQHSDANGNSILLPDTDSRVIPSHTIITNGERILVGSFQTYQDLKSYTGVAPVEDFVIGGKSGKKFIKKEIIVVLSAKIIK